MAKKEKKIKKVKNMKKVFLNKERMHVLRQQIEQVGAHRLLDSIGVEIQKETANEIFFKLRDERTASAHIRKSDLAFCDLGMLGAESSSRNPKFQGGAFQLIQAAFGLDNVYAAARKAIEIGLCSDVFDDLELVKQVPKNKKKEKRIADLKDLKSEGKKKGKEGEKQKNLPIRQNLIPLLMLDNPDFENELKTRGISKETMKYLGAGYLEKGKLKKIDHPMNNRIVFQVRGVEYSPYDNKKGDFKRVVLAHTGRTMDKKQVSENGKYWAYGGFKKSLELYNIDNLVLDERAKKQVEETRNVIICEGFFDVAKLVEAGIYNAVATMGSHFDEKQLDKANFIKKSLNIENFKFLVWYDRDEKAQDAQNMALELLKNNNFSGIGFDWDKGFHSKKRGFVEIPKEITDPCDFSVEQLKFLRKQGVI